MDAERRKKWKMEREEITLVEQKKSTYEELLSKLKSLNSTAEGSNPAATDTLVVTLPADWLEYFWLLDMEVPITASEVSQSIRMIESRLT